MLQMYSEQNSWS